MVSTITVAVLCCALASLQLAYATTDRQNAFETWSEKEDCRDEEPACQDWADKGECERNPKFMLTRCPVACKQCQPPDVNPRDYAGEVLVLNSSLGQIRIVPDFVRAPVTSALVLELANHPDACHNCNFYRNEAVPQDGSSGPPYGLLQGSLAGLLRVPEKEGGDIAMKRGHVAMIPGTREFFVNVMDHDTWGSSMTVWGSLADRQSMDLVEAMLRLPYKEVKHPTYGTVMRMLEQTVSFTALAAPAEGAAGATGTAEAAGGAAGVQ